MKTEERDMIRRKLFISPEYLYSFWNLSHHLKTLFIQHDNSYSWRILKVRNIDYKQEVRETDMFLQIG